PRGPRIRSACRLPRLSYRRGEHGHGIRVRHARGPQPALGELRRTRRATLHAAPVRTHAVEVAAPAPNYRPTLAAWNREGASWGHRTANPTDPTATNRGRTTRRRLRRLRRSRRTRRRRTPAAKPNGSSMACPSRNAAPPVQVCP